jgi:hypothetical protein
MSLRQAFVSLLHLFCLFAFFLAGCLFVSMPYLPEIKTHLFENCTLIGSALFLSALLLLLGFYALERGRYLVLQMGVIPLVIQKSVLPASDSHEIRDPSASINLSGLSASTPAAPDSNFGRLLGTSRSLNRSRYKTSVNIIKQTLEDELRRQFPQKMTLSEVEIGAKSILEIQVSLKTLNEEEREKLFIQAEKHLSLLLYERFGYSKPFHLIVKL